MSNEGAAPRRWMSPRTWLALRLLLAFMHTFPVRRHLGAFVSAPSLGEAWKGFGAILSIGLFLLPARGWAALFAALRRRPGVAASFAVLLAVAHVVPASDHLPRFFAAPSFADAWRGFGAAFAAAWFASRPLRRRDLASRPLRVLTTLFR